MRTGLMMVLLMDLARPVAGQALSLREAAARAAAGHPAVVAARAEARAGVARVDQARAGTRPRLEYSESAMRGDNPVYVFGALLSQRQFGSGNFAIGKLNRPGFLNNFQSLLTVEQTLWDAGRSRRSTAAEGASLQAREAAVRAREQSLVAHAARAYLDAQLAAASVEAAGQSVRSAEQDLEQAKAVRDAGRATDADVLAVEVHLAAMREQQIVGQAGHRMALAALNEAMGLQPDTRHELTTRLTASAKAPPSMAGERADVEAARAELRAAGNRLAAARAGLLPQVAARGAFEADRQTFVTRSGANWTGSVSLRWSLFEGGAGRARVAEARALADAGASLLREREGRASLEREQALAALESALARVTASAPVVTMAEESLRVTRNRYGAGLAAVAELLRAETALVEARFRALHAIHAERVARIDVELAAGRLTAASEVLE